MNKINNTVSAVNQMINSSELCFLGSENAKKRILIVGNSITRHGPLPEIGWEYDWGMAASSRDKDYVHRLYAKLTESGHDVFMRIRQASHWERNFLKEDVLSNYLEDREFNADIVIFRLGENVLDEDTPYLKNAIKAFVEYLCVEGKMLFTTCFWDIPKVDEAIKAVVKERGDRCVDVCLSKDETNMAAGQFWHGGICSHPSDKGMEGIAEIIFNELQNML